MKKLTEEDKAGLYITVIVHLTVIIVLLATSLGSALKHDSFLIDFSAEQPEEQKHAAEPEKEDQSFDEAISERVEELINGTSGENFKNIAVDRSSALKDDRGTDADQLYKDAENLAKELNAGFEVENDENYAPIKKNEPEKKTAQKTYSGPSVVSYSLGGRKASKLPIPAYRCYGGGMVTVIITVDPAGNVVDAKIQDETSSDDTCLRIFAIRAARMSKFSADPHAPHRQGGDIVYQFISQN